MDSERTVLTGGIIYDGTGGEPFPGDVFLHGDRIEAVVPPGTRVRAGWRTVSVRGCAVCPGFIDAHAHSDLTLPANPKAESKLFQGITTEISGNCGQSFFPVTELNREHLERDCRNLGLRLDWSGAAGYFDWVERAGPALNCAFLCGHNTLRAAVAGYGKKRLTESELHRMKELLRDALRAGSPGLSTGLIYVPGRFAGRAELSELCSVLREFDALYATHMRSEGDGLLEALDEALDLARCGSGRLEISHLKTAQPRNWGKLDEVLNRIEAARASGLRVTADRYPWVHSQTSLSVVLPGEYDSMTDAEIQTRLSASGTEREKLLPQLENRPRWDRVILSFTALPEYRALLGLPVPEAAARTGMTPGAFVLDVLTRDAARARGAFGGLSPENMERIILRDWVCCGTDESARPPGESLGRSHPRGFDSFPRFLNLVSSRSGLAEAVRKVTSLPASVFRLRGRGVLKPGACADLTVLDPDRYRGTADFASPHGLCQGVRRVWVNGVPALDPDGTIRCAGRVCR